MADEVIHLFQYMSVLLFIFILTYMYIEVSHLYFVLRCL